MQSNKASNKDSANRRTAPKGMPSHAPTPKSNMMRGNQKLRDILPQQAPVTDDELVIKKPSKLKTLLLRVAGIFAVVFLLAFVYIFLLLGEPTEEVKQAIPAAEEKIQMPMHAIESPGEASMQSISDTFGQPVLSYTGSDLSTQKSRIYDTAFQGGFARRVTISYAFSDGSTLLAQSLRPTAAIALLSSPSYSLQGGSLYTLGGITAARMDSDDQICIFTQGEGAAYALICPKSHAEDLTLILRQIRLTQPSATN